MTRPTVLVVDDHPLNVKLVRYALRSHGLDTVSAGSANEAWEVLERSVPALVLMDVQLPGTDGLALTRRIRSDRRFDALPIVAITAYAMASDESAALAAGCNAFVAKPIDPRGLGELVRRMIHEAAPP